MNKLLPSFQQSLFEPLSSSLIELGELGIDSILNDGLLRDMPFVGAVVAVGRTAQNLHDRNMLKQTIKFITTFNSGEISEDKIRKYRSEVNQDPQKCERELGRVLIILNNIIDSKKSQILAKMFRAYVNEEIEWEKFIELSDVITRIFVVDLELLFKIYACEVTDTTQCSSYQADRLMSVGFLNLAMKSHWGQKTDNYISITEFGSQFCEIVME